MGGVRAHPGAANRSWRPWRGGKWPSSRGASPALCEAAQIPGEVSSVPSALGSFGLFAGCAKSRRHEPPKRRYGLVALAGLPAVAFKRHAVVKQDVIAVLADRQRERARPADHRLENDGIDWFRPAHVPARCAPDANAAPATLLTPNAKGNWRRLRLAVHGRWKTCRLRCATLALLLWRRLFLLPLLWGGRGPTCITGCFLD